MPRQSSTHRDSSWFQRVQRVFSRWPRVERSRQSTSRRRLRFESLETRTVLATDFGQITGLIYQDDTGNGFTVGEQVVGATVNLFVDDGDNVFEPGAGDPLASAVLTDANGRYRFSSLTAGDYWVQQPAQIVSSVGLSSQVGARISISGLEAQGVGVTTIDDFNSAPQQAVQALFPVGSTDSSASVYANSIGGERDLFVQLTSGILGENVDMDSQAGRLRYQSSDSARGLFRVAWDGVDGDPLTLAATGLGGLDLTSAGTATTFDITLSADHVNATAQLRVYSSAANFSQTALFTIPGTNVLTNTTLLFTNFVLGGGTGADFTNVGAIELEIVGNTDGTDGRLTLLRTFGPTTKTLDFSNCADLALTKTVNTATPSVGQNVTFTITLGNAGPGDANNVAVTDLLPAGLTFVSATPSQGTYLNGTGVWTIGTVAVNTTQTLTIVATVANGGVKTNAAAVTASDNCDPVAANDTANATVTPLQIDLSVTKTASSATPNVGQNLTFTVTVTNEIGRDNATGVQVTDLLPAGLTFVSATPSGTTTYNSGTGVWAIGNLSSGSNATLTIVATVATSGAKINTAEVTAANQPDVDSTPNNNGILEDDQASVTITPPVIDLSVTKTASSSIANVGQSVTFTVTVTNAVGRNNATGVQLSDVLPAGLTFVSATPSGTTTFNNGTGVWTVGNLNAGASATLAIVTTVTTSIATINMAEVTAADQFDIDSTPNNGANNEDDQASVTVAPPMIDLSLTKTVNDATPDRNQNVTFTLTVSNAAGRDNATGVQVTDVLPAGLTFVSATPSGTTTFNNGTGVWTVGSLNAGANATLAIVATVTTSTPIVNAGEVSAADQLDIDSTPNNGATIEDDRATVTLTPNIADVSLTKTVNNSAPLTGQNLTFTITATNAGPATATGVQVTDALPAGLTFVSATPSGATTFDSVIGIWTIGTLNNGGSATLLITATMATNTNKSNTAQVTVLDQFDPDSTPNNNAEGEDDQATVPLVSRRLSKRSFLAE